MFMMFNGFQCDVVVVAPACAAVIDEISETPASWTEANDIDIPIPVDSIIKKAKPVEALDEIYSNSWLTTKRKEWKLDGV